MATMTRQHFEIIAETIRDGRRAFKSNTAHAKYAAETAGRLAHTNTNFDPARFVIACMPRAWVGTRHAAAWDRAAEMVGR